MVPFYMLFSLQYGVSVTPIKAKVFFSLQIAIHYQKFFLFFSAGTPTKAVIQPKPQCKFSGITQNPSEMHYPKQFSLHFKVLIINCY